MKTIWCLFSIACDYNQPDFNLDCWWSEKPDINKLSKVLQLRIDILVDLLNKNYVNVGGCNYSLMEVKEGEILK